MARDRSNDFLQLTRWQQALGVGLALFILIGIAWWLASTLAGRVVGPEPVVGGEPTHTQEEKMQILEQLEASNRESSMNEAEKLEVLKKLERGEAGSE